MIKGSKALSPRKLACRWGQWAWDPPYMSKKWGRGPTDCEWRVGLWECEARNNPYLIKNDPFDSQIII